MKKIKKGGIENTEIVFKIVSDYLNYESDISKLVISSTTGYTISIADKFLKDYHIDKIVCSQDLNNKYFMTKETREKIVDKGYFLYEIPKQYLKNSCGLKTSQRLRNIAQGIKVCVEMTEYLIEAGVMKEGDKILAIAGTIRGADTASVISITKRGYKFNKILCFPEEE